MRSHVSLLGGRSTRSGPASHAYKLAWKAGLGLDGTWPGTLPRAGWPASASLMQGVARCASLFRMSEVDWSACCHAGELHRCRHNFSLFCSSRWSLIASTVTYICVLWTRQAASFASLIIKADGDCPLSLLQVATCAARTLRVHDQSSLNRCKLKGHTLSSLRWKSLTRRAARHASEMTPRHQFESWVSGRVL